MNKITIQLPVDSDGFVEYRCPFCNNIFRLKTNEFNNLNKNSLMCVYCGISSNVNKYMPKDIEEFIQVSTMKYIQAELDNVMKKIKCKSKFISVKYQSMKKIETKNIHFDESVSSIIKCEKCNNKIKVKDGSELKHFCPYCEAMF